MFDKLILNVIVLVCYDSLYQTVDMLYITKEKTIIKVFVTNLIRRFITKKDTDNVNIRH